eukprot:TRINITY_DN7173_c0_g1_i1.p1 TRINITY_DN7173_c0_g1~~TRINITY_DN7173_c0_g1_i1.p1  ORF type:complete len:164 (-),score=38.26 TRINITY_DN7173_c0_g1_i1:52-543(-)
MCMHIKLFVSPLDPKLYLSALYESGEIFIWSIEDRKIVMSGKLHSEPALSLDLNNDRSMGISSSAGNKIVVFEIDWSLNAIRVVKELEVNKGGISEVRYRHDNKIFASAGWDHRVRIYHSTKLTPLAILKWHTATLNAIDFCRDTNLLASAGKDSSIAIWSIY